MAVTIVRTAWIDDDGSGTTGTVINNAIKTDLYGQIDGGFAKLAQLTGGNTFIGDQTIATSGTATSPTVNIRNALAGAGNYAELSLGNDAQARALIVQTYSSVYSSSGLALANSSVVLTQGAGGLTVGTVDAAPVRFGTNFAERMRILGTGAVLINGVTNANNAQLGLAFDGGGSGINGLVLQNSSATPTCNYVIFANSANGGAGAITQVTATSVVYTTSSDHRLKDDLGRADDLTALRAVVVHDFTWIADGVHDRGVFAQEAQAHFPRAVVAGTDDRTADGTLARPWMTDYSKFVPDLIVGWQLHEADIASLWRAVHDLPRGEGGMTRTLDAADYWKLRAICSEAQRAELLALQARAELAAAQKKQTAALVELGLDASAPSFSLDDDTLTITVPEAPC